MVGLDKTRHFLSSNSLDTHPDTAPLLGGGPHPPLRALYFPRRSRPAPITTVNTGQRPREGGVVWKSFKDSVTLVVDAQKPGPLPWWGGKCGDARGARPSKAQAGVWRRVRLRAFGEELSRSVGFLEDICHSSRSGERPPYPG